MTDRPDFTWNDERPLDRAPGETKKANAALWDYYNMGPGRSLIKLRDQYLNAPKGGPRHATRQITTLKRWSSRYSWQLRIGSADQIARRREEREWAERRRENKERLWQINEAMIAKAESMANWPLAERVIPDREGELVRIVPANWNMGHTARMVAEILRINAVLFGEPNEVTEHRHSGQVGIVSDLAAMSEDQLYDQLQELRQRLDAPGPGEIHEPGFNSGPEKAPESPGPDNG